MKQCPKCNSEYEEEYTICSDCNCELVEKEVIEEPENNNGKISKGFLFILAIVLILFSPIISFKLTLIYFNLVDVQQYSAENFKWMLGAYHQSLLVVGIIICLHCILYFYKSHKS
ncbi:hypothetical protein [Clostridium manihotivorum]|uniref:Zinc ribbon domain-containing protein n=1 Tax=Clostridium manihotivorum TaxID=2320868 RepID=A0A410DV99_9CLOT|nr:hypothetical protein [Clostridium manihotivorum]QAA33133.1 hypothetical protein C1I91_16645 [Clostridium manihotivorum]